MGRVDLQRGSQRIGIGIGVVGQQVARYWDALAGGESVCNSDGPAIDPGHRCGDHDQKAVGTAQTDELSESVKQCLDDPGRTGKPVGTPGVNGDTELVDPARSGELRVRRVRVPAIRVDRHRPVRWLLGELVSQLNTGRARPEVTDDNSVSRLSGRLDRARGGLLAEKRVADNVAEGRGAGLGRGRIRRRSNWCDRLADTAH